MPQAMRICWPLALLPPTSPDVFWWPLLYVKAALEDLTRFYKYKNIVVNGFLRCFVF